MQLKHYCKGRFRTIRKQRRLFHHRTWLVMKLTIIILLAACLQVSAKGFSQTITLTGKDLSLEKIFKEVKRQSGYLFVYRDEWLKQAKNVDVSISNGTVEQVLDYCFKGQPLTYSIVDKTVVVRLKEEEKKADSTPVIKLTGKVTDKSTGKPLEGASVMIKYSKTGTSTNGDGMFVIEINNPAVVLVVLFTGYKATEIPVAGRIRLDIELEPATSNLDEVVTIAYGQTTNRFNTGSISKINSGDIEREPIANPLAALAGNVPGLTIVQTSGLPGAGFNIQIRGRNSIDNGNDPLYVIDGVPFNGNNPGLIFGPYSNVSLFNSINPGDIESIEVLKDADATAIYGSRGANGVILITTKKGRPGKTNISFSAYTGIGNITRSIPLLNTQEYLLMRREAFNNDDVEATSTTAPDLFLWDTTRYTDWTKELIGGTSSINDIQASVSGGSDQTQFLLGAGYHRETTVYPGDFADIRPSVHFNLTHSTANKKLTLNLSASYSNDKNNLPLTDVTGYLWSPPDAPEPYDSSGKLNWAGGTFDNPYSKFAQKYNSTIDNLISSFYLKYKIIDGLQFNINAGYNNSYTNQSYIVPQSTQNPRYNPSSSATFSNNNIKSWIAEPNLTYIHVFKNTRLEGLFGSTWQQQTSDGNTISASGYASESQMRSPDGATYVNVDSKFSQYNYMALYARINLQVSNKYLLNLSGRRDGSSRFGPGRQFANFGAVGVGWIFSEESWVRKNLSFLSFGKLRGSYGTSGNDQIGNYQYLDSWRSAVYSFVSAAYSGINGLTPSRLYNPDYAWEENKKIEAALELGFMHDRLQVNVNYFQNRSSNQLINASLPGQTGFSSIIENFPAVVQNSGFEFMIRSVNLKSKTWEWTSSFNLSLYRNKLISFPGLETSSYANSYIIGQPLSIKKLYHFTGVDPTTGIYTFASTEYPKGLTRVKDLTPSFYGGFKNSIRYKRLQLDFLFQFTKQLGRSFTAGRSNSAPGMMYNVPKNVLSRWQNPGDNTDIQKYTATYSPAEVAYNYYAYQSDAIYVDASFIRLKNVSISYSLPSSWLSKFRISQLLVYLRGQNLLTITSFPGSDPENDVLGSSMPPLKIFTGGIQFNF